MAECTLPPIRAALAAAVFLSAACSVHAPHETSSGAVRGVSVMGTVLTIEIEGADPEDADALFDRAFSIARHWDDVLTTWRPSGELARLNARAGTGFVSVSAELLGALERMRKLSAQTQGAFDPAVRPLVRALQAPGMPPPPALDPFRIRSAVRIAGVRVSLTRGAALDAGAIGKGIAVDAIVDAFRFAGVDSAYIDFGGSSIAAIGTRLDGTPWRVALVGPSGVVGTAILRDRALSTSRSVRADDPVGAIVDPRTAVAVPPGRVATAISSSATIAEAWSTALVVLGRSGLARAAEYHVNALIADGNGIAATPGDWFQRLAANSATLHPHREPPNRKSPRHL